MKDILIIGAGGFGREMIALINNTNTLAPVWNLLGLLDDGKPVGEVVNGIKVLGSIGYLEGITEETAVIIAISLPHVRKEIRERITNKHVYFPAMVHPRAFISDGATVSLGEGSIICANVLLTVNIVIDDFALINAGAILNHDAVAGKYSTIMPGVNISTGAKVGEGCYVGTGCKISKPVIIPDWEKLPAGTIIA